MAQQVTPEVLLPVVAEVFKKAYTPSQKAQEANPEAYRREVASFFVDLYFDIKRLMEEPAA